MRIRDVEIAPCLALAPMEGVTDLTFRRLIRQIGGCGLTVTEFVPARGLSQQHRKVMRMVAHDVDESPLAIQVFGRDPEVLAEGARFAQDLGANIVDLNMGCPSKKVCAHSGGSALMKEPALATEIVRAMRRALTVPFTVKMRAGWDPDHKTAPELARIFEGEGVDGLAVHWRTRTDLYGGVRELDTLARVKDSVCIPVFANGDIVDASSALDTLARTGCDGLMIGRGAVRNPWVFREIEAALEGRTYPAVTHAERERVLVDYYRALQDAFRTDHGALGRMKKIARYFTNGVPHGQLLRTAIWHAKSVDEALERIGRFFEDLRSLEQGRGDPFSSTPTKRRSRSPHR